MVGEVADEAMAVTQCSCRHDVVDGLDCRHPRRGDMRVLADGGGGPSPTTIVAAPLLVVIAGSRWAVPGGSASAWISALSSV